MAELEIDKEDVHDRKKWNVMKRKSNPIGKRTIYIYIYIAAFKTLGTTMSPVTMFCLGKSVRNNEDLFI